MDELRRGVRHRAVVLGFSLGALVGDAVGGALIQRIGYGVCIGIGGTLLLYVLLSAVVKQVIARVEKS